MAKSKYRMDFPKLAEEYAKQGMIDKEIALKLGISKETFYKYQKKYPDFSDSIKVGKGSIDHEVQQSLYKRTKGFEYEETHVEYKDFPKPGEKAKPTSVRKITKMIIPDVTACIFWLKNRMPERWRDKQEHDVRIKGSLSIEDMRKNLEDAKGDGSQ